MSAPHPIDPDPIELTMCQAALWFGQTLDPENTTFNVCDAVEFHGAVDTERLIAAAHQAVTESDALTTRFTDAPDGWRQRPGAFRLAPPEVVDLETGDHSNALWPTVSAFAARWTGAAHDLSAEPGIAHWIVRAGGRTLWVLAAHHALIDAYGLSAVFTRGADLYRRSAGADRGPDRPLADIAEVVAADLEYLDSTRCAEDAAFWDEQLRGTATGAAAQQARAARSARATIAPIEGDWTSQITAATAAFEARRTGRDRVNLGFLLMNRLGLPAARVPTSAVNLVPLVVPTAAGDTVAQLVAATTAAMREAGRHQRYRGPRVGDGTLTSGFTRHAGRVVNVKPFATTLDFAGVPATVHSVERGPVQDYSITVARDADGRPEVILDADAAIYDDDALGRLLDEVCTFFGRFTAPENADLPIARLPLISRNQRAAVAALGDGGPNPEGATSLIELFAGHAADRPDEPAVVAHDGTLTFAELAARAGRVHAVLAAHGIGPEDRVAIVAESSAAAVAAVLGCWRAGAAYVPVDPGYPAERIAHVLTDSAPRAILTAPEARPALDDAVARGLVAPGTPILPLTPPTTGDPGPAPLRPHPDTAAYVLYTSGSTGRPKGVVVSHRAVATLLGSHRRHAMLPGRKRRVFSAHTLSFDSSVANLMWMCDGHTLHMIDRADVTDAALVVDYVRRHRIDYLDAVPVLLDEYVRAGLVETAPGRHCPESLSTGGEAFPPRLWTELTERTDLRVHNMYGPTEVTVDSAFGFAADTPLPSIGGPSLGARAHVLDRHLQPVAEGRTGELYLSSAQLARGYLGRPGLTAERFVADPFDAAGGRLYRTGDLVRWNAFGGLDYLGRADDQIQLAGFRIEFGEVEALVARAADGLGLSAEQVVADVRVSSSGTRRLVGYLTGVPEAHFAALRTAVAAAAPAHLVPAVFVAVDEIPLSPNGKTDRAALPDPWAGLPARAAGPTGAGTLTGVIAELLDLSEVSDDDDFFSLGGDSIIAIQLTSRARALGLAITPRQVFELRTPRALTAAAADSAESAPTADPAEAYGELPPTPLMRRVLRGGRIAGFAQIRVLALPAGTDRELLAEAINATARRHPVLSARLDGEALTVPAPDSAPTVEVTEHRLDAGGDGDVSAQITRLATAAAAQIRLDRPGLLRALLVRELPADGGDALILVIHHLAVDGVSWRILVEDLRTAYAQVCAARPAQLDPEGTSFRGWARALADRAADPALTGTWEHPGGPGELTVGPLDPDRDTAGATAHLELTLPAAAVTDLPELYRTGPTEILLATFAAAVGAVLSDPADEAARRLFVDVEGHGRDETLVPGADLARTVGWFTAFWPVPIALPGTVADSTADARSALDSLIKQVKETLAAAPHSGLDYGLAAELAPGAPRRTPAPVLFNYLGRLTTGEGTAPFSALWPQRPLLVVRDPAMPLSHPLECNAIAVAGETGLEVRAELSWAPALLTAGRAAAIGERWQQLLTLLAEAPTEIGGATPSDFLVDDLTQDEVDEFADLFG